MDGKAFRAGLGTAPVEGWSRVGEVDGVPLSQWGEDTMVRVVTFDDDVLRTIGAGLNYCVDHLSEPEFRAFLEQYLPGGTSGVPSGDEHTITDDAVEIAKRAAWKKGVAG
jgi:hypothetical protein